MVHWVLLVCSAPFEGPQPSVPLVVTPEAVTRTCDSKCRIAARQVWLTVDRRHDPPRLHPFDISDEWPKQMQRRLDLERGHDTPAAVRGPLGSVLADAGDVPYTAHRGLQSQKLMSA